jgi:NADH-quinone oxidoreductase subunit C
MTLSEELAPFALSSWEKFGELTVTIAADRLVDTCRFLKDSQRFVRLSTMTAVDRFTSEPRFEVV